MSDVLFEAIRFNGGDKHLKRASVALLEQAVVRVNALLAEAREHTEEVKRLIGVGQREAATAFAEKGREVLRKSRVALRDDIQAAVTLLRGEDRREAVKLFGPLYEKLVELTR